MASDGDAGTSWWNRHGKTVILLLVFFAAALFIRSYFNFDASYNEGDFRWSGTDGYYHMRVIDHLRDTGEFLLRDGMINYPVGATNPRPPLFDWTIGAVGGLMSGLFGGDSETSTNYAAAYAPAVWGALTVFPVYFLGREVFGRKAGLWASFFIGIMAAHVTRSNLGALDHDATILFFFSLGAFFFARSLNLLKHHTYVEDYRRGGIGEGVKRFFAENQSSIAYAALTGAAFAGIALTWKGYTYAFAVFAVWYGFQLLANHLRRVDSTPYFFLAMIPFLVTLVLIWPYYAAVGRIDSAVMPTVGILVGVLFASLIFVPTRHLPPVLVLPVTGGGILVALLLMLVVLPAVGELYFTGLGYFVQNKLYSTIAEAQRTPLGYLVFSTGIIPFFFAIGGIVMAIRLFLKQRADSVLFALCWAAVGLFMAFTATRFVFNASVGFALMAGWVTARFISYIRFGEVSKVWKSVRSAGYGLFKSARSSVGFRHAIAAIFIVFILLLPNVWLGVDAGVPREYQQARLNDPDASDASKDFWANWFGALGQDFLSQQWIDALGYLNDQDSDVDPIDRPAFIAWWDYGFYAVQRGGHPTVADPFQFGYQISGRFLASQSEGEGITFMAIRLLEGDAVSSEPRGQFAPAVVSALDAQKPGLAAELLPLVRAQNYDAAYDVLIGAIGDGTTVGESEAAAFYATISDSTSNQIRYFTLDGRMFPCDDPRSRGVDASSIFYAPVYLADKNPEDFVRTRFEDGQGQSYFQKIYQTTADGGSQQVENPYVVDNIGNRYILSGGTLLPMGKNGFVDYSNPLHVQGIQLATPEGELEYEPAFYNTLLYKAWAGPAPANPEDKVPTASEFAPGQGLKHFRLVYTTARVAEDDAASNRCFENRFGATTGLTSGVSVLKYYDGAPISGVIRDSAGQPMDGVTVRVADNFGIAHDTMVTGTDGAFSLIAPFSTDNNGEPSPKASEERALTLRGTGPNMLEAVLNGQVVATQNFSVSDEQAMGGGPAIDPFTMTVELGTIEGMAYDDVDADGVYTAANDTVLSNVIVSIGDRNTTTDNQGKYAFANVRPGVRTLNADHEHYDVTSGNTVVPPGGAATLDFAMTHTPLQVSGVLTHAGLPVTGAAVKFSEPVSPDAQTPDERQSPPSNLDGNYTVALSRGTWEVSVDYQTSEGNETVRYYTTTTQTIQLQTGDPERTLDLVLEREVIS